METASMVAGPRRDLLSKLGRRITPWFRTSTLRPRAASPTVSFTFDDIPDSALHQGARVLEEHASRGTFYVAGGLCDKRFQSWTFAPRAELPDLLARGHEIGCHTFRHPDLHRLVPAAVERELDDNAEFFRQLAPAATLRNFAYPYGSTGIAQKRVVQRRFRSARSVAQGINHGVMDLGQLKAFRLYDVLLDAEALERLVAETVAVAGWLIFYTHDVDAAPSSQGCSPRLLDTALRAARRQGAAIMTVDAALDRLTGAPAA